MQNMYYICTQNISTYIFIKVYLDIYLFFLATKKNVARAKECCFLFFNPFFNCFLLFFLWNKQSGQDLALIIIMRDLVPLWKTWSH